MQSYAPGVTRRIPAAAVAVEDAEAMARMQARGQRITVSLYMEGAWCGVRSLLSGSGSTRSVRSVLLPSQNKNASLRVVSIRSFIPTPQNAHAAQNLAPAESHNVVAEWRGSETPEEVVLLSGHLDSWDVGVGAMDDGGGVAIAWQALSTLRALVLRPRRTVRLVLWASEEFGGVG